MSIILALGEKHLNDLSSISIKMMKQIMQVRILNILKRKYRLKYQLRETQKNELVFKPLGQTQLERSPRPSQETKIKHRTKRQVGDRLRFKVMRRDYFKCIYCGRAPATDPEIKLHMDHIIPWSKGGETTFENLQTLCSVCNIGKGNLLQ